MIDTSCKRNKISLPPGVRRRWSTNWLLAMKWYQNIIIFDVHRLIHIVSVDLVDQKVSFIDSLLGEILYAVQKTFI